jgi:hypothetical protein
MLESKFKSQARSKPTYGYEIVGIGAMEVGDSDALGKRLLAFEALVEAFAEVGLYAHSLQDENAHADETLLRRVVLVIHRVEQYQNNEVMRPIGVDYEGSESLVALECLPE